MQGISIRVVVKIGLWTVSWGLIEPSNKLIHEIRCFGEFLHLGEIPWWELRHVSLHKKAV